MHNCSQPRFSAARTDSWGTGISGDQRGMQPGWLPSDLSSALPEAYGMAFISVVVCSVKLCHRQSLLWFDFFTIKKRDEPGRSKALCLNENN